jgi:hypothetical protein
MANTLYAAVSEISAGDPAINQEYFLTLFAGGGTFTMGWASDPNQTVIGPLAYGIADVDLQTTIINALPGLAENVTVTASTGFPAGDDPPSGSYGYVLEFIGGLAAQEVGSFTVDGSGLTVAADSGASLQVTETQANNGDGATPQTVSITYGTVAPVQGTWALNVTDPSGNTITVSDLAYNIDSGSLNTALWTAGLTAVAASGPAGVWVLSFATDSYSSDCQVTTTLSFTIPPVATIMTYQNPAGATPEVQQVQIQDASGNPVAPYGGGFSLANAAGTTGVISALAAAADLEPPLYKLFSWGVTVAQGANAYTWIVTMPRSGPQPLLDSISFIDAMPNYPAAGNVKSGVSYGDSNQFTGTYTAAGDTAGGGCVLGSAIILGRDN